MPTKSLLLALSFLLSGCFSAIGHLDGERCVYNGTRTSWAWANYPHTMSGWPFLIDAPFSFALDTVLLPYDLTAFLPEDMGGDPEECVISETLRVM